MTKTAKDLRDCWTDLAPPGFPYECNLDPKLEQSCNLGRIPPNPNNLDHIDANNDIVERDREI